MTDEEYLKELRDIRNLKITKEEWDNLDDELCFEIIEKLRGINKHLTEFKKNKILKNLKDLDPFDEENWDSYN